MEGHVRFHPRSHIPCRSRGPRVAELTALAGASVCLALGCWGANAWFPDSVWSPGNDLRVDGSSPKLNTTSAEGLPRLPASAPEEELDTHKQVRQPTVPAAATLPPSAAEIDLRPVVPELGAQAEPSIGDVGLPKEPPQPLPAVIAKAAPPACTSIYVPQRGETPMLRTWKMLALPAVLSAAFTTAPPVARAGGSDGGEKNPVLEKLMQMEKRVNEAFKKIEDDMLELKAEALTVKPGLEAAQKRVKQLEKDLVDMRDDMANMRNDLSDLKKRIPSSTQALYPPPDKASLDDLKARLGKVEQDFGKLSGLPQTSFYPARPGRLRLVNEYSEDMLFIVNGRSYRVAPGAIQVLDQVPAGAFSYEVVSPTWGLRGRNTPDLASGETFTITAR
jgi:archaellum component FlaC